MFGSPWQIAIIYLLFINALSALLFAIDKHRAKDRSWRIPEKTLLLSALFGGTLGAYWARNKFRHKTRKQPFSRLLHGVAALQVLTIFGVLWLVLSGKYG